MKEGQGHSVVTRAEKDKKAFKTLKEVVEFMDREVGTRPT